MNLFDKLEKKIGRFAIPHLMRYIIIAYAVGYLLYITGNFAALNFLALDAEAILHGQVWRIFTYIIQPPNNSLPIFVLLTLYFYYMIGRFLEGQWGTFKFNLYFFSGMFLNVLAAIIIYLIFGVVMPMSVYYINLSLFMAFALEQPDTYMMLFFIIPFKVRWFAIIDGIYFAITVFFGFLSIAVQLPVSVLMPLYYVGINPTPTGATAALIAMLNFIVFYFLFKAGKKNTWSQKTKKRSANDKAQRSAYGSKAASGTARIPRHRCAICGKTELNAPDEEFRFCTSCAGAFEYCSAHLRNHNHVYRDKDGNLKRD